MAIPRSEDEVLRLQRLLLLKKKKSWFLRFTVGALGNLGPTDRVGLKEYRIPREHIFFRDGTLSLVTASLTRAALQPNAW